MSQTRRILAGFLCLMFFVYFAPLASAKANAAEIFATGFGNKVLKVLSGNESQSEKQRKFKALFSQNTEIDIIARFMLGKYARSLTPQQSKEFNNLLQGYIARVFVRRMSNVKGTKLVVVKTLELKPGKDYLVQTIASIEGQEPTRVNWRIYKNKAGKLKLFDISIEGLWLAQEQRSVFTDMIGRNNGDVKVLLAYLRE